MSHAWVLYTVSAIVMRVANWHKRTNSHGTHFVDMFLPMGVHAQRGPSKSPMFRFEAKRLKVEWPLIHVGSRVLPMD